MQIIDSALDSGDAQGFIIEMVSSMITSISVTRCCRKRLLEAKIRMKIEERHLPMFQLVAFYLKVTSTYACIVTQLYWVRSDRI